MSNSATGVVYARMDGMVCWSQGQTPLSKGDVWDAMAPLVLERPDLFSTEPTRIRGQVYRSPAEQAPAEQAPAEDATAAPGAKRSTRRKAG